jgi:hypothetical protein
MKVIENKWSINDIWWFKNLENKKVYQNTHEIKEHRLYKVNNSFMLKFVLLKPSFTSINCNDERVLIRANVN